MFTVSSKAILQTLLKSNGRKHSQESQGAWDDEEMPFSRCSPRAGQELRGQGVEAAADPCSMTQSIPAPSRRGCGLFPMVSSRPCWHPTLQPEGCPGQPASRQAAAQVPSAALGGGAGGLLSHTI